MSHSIRARSVDELHATEVHALLEAGEIILIDVREPAEYAAERIHGALLFPLSTFDPRALPADPRRRVVLHCGSGKRSLAAAHRCLETSSKDMAHMAGGMLAWKAAGHPIVRIDPATGRVVDAGSR